MKFTKIKSVEILTDGSLNFTETAFITPEQTIFYKKDHKSLICTRKNKILSTFELSNNIYKARYKH